MEQQFLYGHHILKSGLGRITENTPRYSGVIVLSMSDVPLVSTVSIILILYCGFRFAETHEFVCLFQGFGKVAKSTAECKHTDPMTIVCFHQADIGEYVRSEENLL